MGVNIHCGKLESMDMSYSTFDRWRVKLAKALNEEFGEKYNDWIFYPQIMTDKHFEVVCNNTPELTDELFDFFVASDCEGEIGKETSRQLLPLIEKLDDEYKIGYLGVCPYDKNYVRNFFKHSIRYNAKVWWS